MYNGPNTLACKFSCTVVYFSCRVFLPRNYNTFFIYKEKLEDCQLELSELLIHCQEGHLLHKTSIIDRLFDALWTPHNNIVYTTFDNNHVVAMADSGEVISYTQMSGTPYLSVSNDGIINVADEITGQ